MSGTINLTGPSTTPGAPAVTPAAINTAVNAALATTLAAATTATAAETTRAEAAEALLAPLASPQFSGTPAIGAPGIALVGSLLQATGTNATTQQIEVQNLSAGTTASSDIVATANDGTDTANYVDLGINSSGNADASFTVAAAHDAYLYANSANLAIGTAATGKAVNLFAGGTLLANLVAVVSASGITVGSPVGGALGAGTLNATGLYINGTAAASATPASVTIIAALAQGII